MELVFLVLLLHQQMCWHRALVWLPPHSVLPQRQCWNQENIPIPAFFFCGTHYLLSEPCYTALAVVCHYCLKFSWDNEA